MTDMQRDIDIKCPICNRLFTVEISNGNLLDTPEHCGREFEVDIHRVNQTELIAVVNAIRGVD